MIEGHDFGSLLRLARERRLLSRAQVAAKTKISPLALDHLEAGRLEDLPAEVFVRGFIRSYAQLVGISEGEPLALYEEALAARKRAAQAELMPPSLADLDADPNDGAGVPRRGLGLAVFVIIVLVIATITLSLFLRQPPQSGERLSLQPLDPPAVATVDRHGRPC